MKTVTFIVKDSETGAVQKFNAKLDYTDNRGVQGFLNGVMVSAKIPHGFEALFGKDSANDDWFVMGCEAVHSINGSLVQELYSRVYRVG